MSIRKISLVPGEFYHIYNRGNSKQAIFCDVEDYARFVCLMYSCNSEYGFRIFTLKDGQTPYDFERGKEIVAIGAYCLMPNHFHILISALTEDGISKFMQKLSTAYSMYFNKKYKRTGGLFEGKFKSEHLYDENYLKYIFSYIHLNPVKLIDKLWKENGIKNKTNTLEFLNNYNHSSYLDFLGKERIENKVINRDPFPSYFPDETSVKKEIFEWLSHGQV